MSEAMNRDDVLVNRVKDGDLDAFESLMGLHVNRLRAFIAMRAPVAHIIDEVAHESFVFAYQRIDEFQQGDFGAWLRAIAFNLLRAELKRASRRNDNAQKYAEELLVTECAATGVEQSPALSHLEACLKLLSGTTRKLIEWRYVEQRRIDAIGRELEQSAVAVRAALFRTRRQLRDCILQHLQTEVVDNG